MRVQAYNFCVIAVLLAYVPYNLIAESAGVRVMEEVAIPFAGFLSKADFDKRYPGEIVTDLSKLDTGWYVIYEHEALSYYFGPILLESTGQDYLKQLENIVGEAVDERPSIEGYRLELSYEPQMPVSDATNASEEGAGTSEPQPAPKPSIFGFFKRLFGFG